MYTTLAQVKQYIGGDIPSTDDNRLMGFILAAENIIDSVRSCAPRRETRLYDYPILARRAALGAYSDAEHFVSQMNLAAQISSGKLPLDSDLLELENVTNGSGADITANIVTEPANLYPRQSLRLVTPGVYWSMGADGRREQVISVTGVWGWNPAYASAWQPLDTLGKTVTASETTFEVTDAEGADENGITPRFFAGQLLRLDTEYVRVLSVTLGSAPIPDALIVRRAQNGTLAAAHAKDSVISVYRPPERIVQCATRIAVWMYRQKDANVFDKTTIMGTGIAITPSALPADAREMLPPRRVI